MSVIGCGAVGLNVLQGAKLVGRRADRRGGRERRQARAGRQFGATHTVDAAQGDVVEQVKALTEGRGADYVFEAAGHAATFRLAIEAVRPGGKSCGWARSTWTRR